jgi:hypothetical protein
MSSLKLSFHRYLPGVVCLELAAGLQTSSYPPSSANRLRAEHCPAVMEATQLGVVVRAACAHRFDSDGDYQVLLYPTVEYETEIHGYELMSPCLIGSNEQSPGYYKIATGISFAAGDVGWMLTPPMDPRLCTRNLTIATGYFEPGYSGPLFAIVRPEEAITIDRGRIIGQLFPLSMAPLSLKEETTMTHSTACDEARYAIRDNVNGIRISWKLLNARLLESGKTGLVNFLEENGMLVDLSS